VLYDAVALMITEEGASLLTNQPAARDFVADAFAHSKFIAYVAAAKPFLTKVVGTANLDDGFIEISVSRDISKFIQECRKLPFWERGAACKKTQEP
jgi:catalase